MISPTSPAPRPSDGEPASGPEDIAQCVARAQTGESAAFAQLYAVYCDTVYRYLYYRIGGRATAEDLCSEAFTRAFQHLDTFTWKGRDFGAWLITIARNLVADHFTSARFKLEVTTGESLDVNDVERSSEDVVVEALRNGRLLDALSQLPPRMRHVAWLWALGTPSSVIAQQLGIRSSTVRVHLHQARQRLAADPSVASFVSQEGP